MPEYKLSYFNLRVLGEPIRWIFAVSGTPFEDVRVPFEQWGEVKPKIGWGQVPVLEVDGREITQAQAICELLGRRFDLCGDSDLDAARCQEYASHVNELRILWKAHYIEQDMDKRAVMVEELKTKTMPEYMKKFNKVVADNGGNYLVGKRLTWADLFLVNFLEIFEDSIDANLLKNSPALRKLKDNVMSIPAIKDWVADRKPTSLYGVTM